MNLIRALFWLGVVAFLMPHEPDLGLGRPGTLYAAHAPANGAANRMWDHAADKLSQLRREFADQGR